MEYFSRSYLWLFESIVRGGFVGWQSYFGLFFDGFIFFLSVYSAMSESPAVNDFVELTFEGEFGGQSPIQGRVLDVGVDPDIHATDMMFVVNDEPGGREVVYGEGMIDGEEWANVTVQNANIKLGENAEWQILD